MEKRLFYIVWAVLFFLSQPGWGQVNSNLGRFEVDIAKGCAPMTVNVTDILGGPTAQYLYDADTCVVSSPKYDPSLCPPTSNTTATTYTYTQPGTYSIVQIVASQVPRGDTLVVEVLAPQTPEYNITLCQGNGAFVNITDTYYDEFLIDFGDGSPPITTTNNTSRYYAGSGPYTITVSGYFTNGPTNCASGITTISPMNALIPPVFSEVAVINQGPVSGQIDIRYQLGSNNIEYKLQMSTDGTTFFNKGPLSGTERSIYDLNTRDSVYCFRLVTRDQCTDTETYSNTICSVNIDVLAQNGQNQVNWDTYTTTEFNRFEIEKNDQPFGPPINVGSIRGVTDTSVDCNVLYCYQVTSVNNDGGRSLSVPRCVNGINSLPPPKVTALTTTIDQNSIVLNWDLQAPINFYRVFRSINNGAFEAIGQGTELPFTDTNLRPQLNNYCYYVIYQNTCGNQSEPSIVSCPVMLSGANSADNKSYVLNWSPYSGWEQGVSEYQLEILDEQGMPIVATISLSGATTSYSDPIIQNRQISQYRITAISRDSVPMMSYSNIIRVDHPLQIFTPNSFTPNNDGLNDTFNAKGLFIKEFTMEIYNRWGELLFHTSDFEQGWNGIYKGSLSPEGTYAYRISAIDPKGRKVVKNGSVHLLRKGY